MGIGINGLGNLQDKFINSLASKPDTGKAKKGYPDFKDTYEKSADNSVYGGTYDKNLSMVQNTKKTETEAPKLSEKAQKVLDELKSRFGDNTDFFVADFSSDEEASRILSNTEKEFGVLISADELEKMADDEDYKNQMMGVIEDGQGKINEFRDSLSDEELKSVKSVGFTVSDDGTLKFFAELQKQSEANSERIEKARQDRKDKAEKQQEEQDKKIEDNIDEKEGKFPMVKRFVKADSLEELADVLRDFLAAKEENKPESINVEA